MTQDEAVQHWKNRAQSEFKAARTLLETEDDDLCGQALFHCHLAIELALKSEYIRVHDDAAPFTHNLNELARSVRETWTQEEGDAFDALSEFAILGRYGDAKWFATQATRAKTTMWIQKTERFLSLLLP